MAAKRLTSVTLKKWLEEFKVKFDYDLRSGKVNRIRCQLCLQWELRIKLCKIFSQVWVSPDSEVIMKESVKKHSESLQHCEACKLQQKSGLGADVYMEIFVLSSPLGKSFLQLREDDKNSLLVC